jgi:hypothetical protein
MPDADPALVRAIAYALAGDPDSAPGVTDPDDLIERLGGTAPLRAHASAVRSAGEPWPHPVPAELRAGLSAAQLHAAIEQARRRIDPPPNRPVRRTAAPDADDLRLLREVPPHHGG